MALSSKKKTLSGSTIERRHVTFLRICIILAIVLMAATLFLQILTLASSSPVKTEDPFAVRSGSFTWTPAAVSVFLTIPAILLILFWMYLKSYFKRNTHGTHIVIPYFEKHPRKKSTKYIYYAFAGLMMVASLVLGFLYFRQLGQAGYSLRDRLIAAIPCLVMFFCIVALLLHVHLMRQRKRSYSHHRHVSSKSGAEETDPEEPSEEDGPEPEEERPGEDEDPQPLS